MSAPPRRLAGTLLTWLRTLTSAAVCTTLLMTFGFQIARVDGVGAYPLKPELSYVKRVIAHEGDRVRIVDGKVYRNDVAVDDSFVSAEYRSREDWGPTTIPEGYHFVMGDHRNQSSDSRQWGFVPKKYIVGKVQLRWWPLTDVTVF